MNSLNYGTSFNWYYWVTRASQVVLVAKNLPANAGDIRDAGSIPELGRSPGGRHGNPFWYSCLENPMDRGAWQATVHGVAKSWTRLKRLSPHAHCHTVWFFSGKARKHLCEEIKPLCYQHNFLSFKKIMYKPIKTCPQGPNFLSL